MSIKLWCPKHGFHFDGSEQPSPQKIGMIMAIAGTDHGNLVILADCENRKADMSKYIRDPKEEEMKQEQERIGQVTNLADLFGAQGGRGDVGR